MRKITVFIHTCLLINASIMLYIWVCVRVFMCVRARFYWSNVICTFKKNCSLAFHYGENKQPLSLSHYYQRTNVISNQCIHSVICVLESFFNIKNYTSSQKVIVTTVSLHNEFFSWVEIVYFELHFGIKVFG